MKILGITFMCLLVCVVQNEAGRSGGGGRSSSGGSRGGGSSHSWGSWGSRPSPSISRPSHSISKPSPSYPAYSAPKPAPSYPVHSAPKPAPSYHQPAYNPSYQPSVGKVHQTPLQSGTSGMHPQGPPITSGGSYPASSGLSGSGGFHSPSNSPSYPPSSGLSGGPGGLTSTNVKPVYNGYNPSQFGGYIPPVHAPSNTHSYPSSGGLSGAGSHGVIPPAVNAKPSFSYPPSHNSPAYPPSSGLSGSGATNMRPTYNNPPAYGAHNPPAYGAQNPPAYSAHYPPAYSAQHPPAYSAHNPVQGPPGGYGYHAPAYNGFNSQPVYHPPAYTAYHPPVYGPPAYAGYGMYAPSYHSNSGSSSTLTNVLGGLAIWNLARSTGHSSSVHHYYHNSPGYSSSYNNQRNPTQNTQTQNAAPLKDLSNCTLTLLSENGTNNVIAIPCEIATSFAPNVKVNQTVLPVPVSTTGDKCSITVLRKGVAENTTIPCSFLTDLNKEANKPLPGKLNCTGESVMDMYDPLVPPCKLVNEITNEDEFRVLPLAPLIIVKSATDSPDLNSTSTTISPASSTTVSITNSTTVSPPTNSASESITTLPSDPSSTPSPNSTTLLPSDNSTTKPVIGVELPVEN